LTSNLFVDLPSSATGDIWYRNSSGFFTRLGLGNSGEALLSNGTLPLWGNPSPGGSAGGDLSGTYPNPTIGNTTVTFAKMQNVATATFLGRTTAGTGSVEALSASAFRTGLGLGTAALLNTGTASGNIPLLGAGGVLPSSVIPSIAITSIQVVADQAARLALANVEVGDVAKQTDNGLSYILSALPASTNSNWITIGDTTINAGDIVSGTIAAARLGSGTANSTTVLYGDGVYRTPAGLFPWTSVSGTTQALAVNNGYISTDASLATFTLPATAAVGDTIKLIGGGAGGWRIAQNASQFIRYGALVSTTGISGRVDSYSATPYSTVEIVCIATNNSWQVLNSTGVLDVV
jgi:hypothetical protein